MASVATHESGIAWWKYAASKLTLVNVENIAVRRNRSTSVSFKPTCTVTGGIGRLRWLRSSVVDLTSSAECGVSLAPIRVQATELSNRTTPDQCNIWKSITHLAGGSCNFTETLQRVNQCILEVSDLQKEKMQVKYQCKQTAVATRSIGQRGESSKAGHDSR